MKEQRGPGYYGGRKPEPSGGFGSRRPYTRRAYTLKVWRLARPRLHWRGASSRMVVAAAVFGCAILISAIAAVVITGTPVGSEKLANVTVAGDQGNPAIAVGSSGDFVIAWESADQDGDGYGIYARMFDSTGSPTGTEFQVNVGTSGDQRHPDIGMNSDGEFDIAWQGWGDHRQGPDYFTLGIFKRVFDSSGSPTTDDVLVNTNTAGNQTYPSLAMTASSRHVISWTDELLDGSGDGVFAVRYGPSENPFGEFQVNTYTTGNQNQSDAAMSALANFVIVWSSYAQDGDEGGIYGQRYSSGGATMGSEFQVNTHTLDDQSAPSIDINSTGAMTVVWSSYGQDGDEYGIYGQRFDENGVKIGGEFRVNTRTAGNQTTPCVAMSPGGSFIIAWVSDAFDGSGDGVFAQQFDETGSPVGSEFKVNSYNPGDQNEPSASWGPMDSFVIAWSSCGQDGDEGGVYFQMYNEVPIPEFSSVVAMVAITLMLFLVVRRRKSAHGCH